MTNFYRNFAPMKQRFLFLLRAYGLTVGIFLCAKVVFMCLNRAAYPFTADDVADVLIHGITLDLSTSLYFLVVPFLLMVASIWWTGRRLRLVLKLWYAVTAVSFVLAFVADSALYPHWGFKLDATCLQYLSTPADAVASVAPLWLALGALVLVVLTVGIYGLYCLCIPNSFEPLRRKWTFGIVCLIAAPLIFLGIRGGLDESTTNIGQVYYSQTPFLNHSAVNPVFSFLASFEGSVRSDVRYSYFTDEECAALTDGLYDRRTVNPDTLLRSQRPDVLVVMLESAAAQFTKMAGKDYIMPNFNRLMDEGVCFTQCYANSFRTDRATVCIWSGHLAFPTMSLQKVPAKNAHLPSLARSLRKVGYSTKVFYGGDINFTNMRSYLVNAGFEDLVSKDDFSRQEQHTAQWGVRDDIVFDRIVDEVKEWDKDDKTPHLIGCFTLSSHQPWDVPTKVLDDEVENAFYYLDQCMGDFVAQLRQLPQWNNLLLIFIPDHGINYDGMDENKAIKNRIPLLWMGGALKEIRTVDVLCNQSDLAATLLGQLGIPHDDFLFSRDVLSETYTKPFAYHTYNNGFSLLDSTRFVVYDLNSEQTLVGDAPDLVKRGKALLQWSSEDLGRR